MDAAGRPSFNALQNYGSSKVSIFYYLFDVLVLEGRNVMSHPLSARSELLRGGRGVELVGRFRNNIAIQRIVV